MPPHHAYVFQHLCDDAQNGSLNPPAANDLDVDRQAKPDIRQTGPTSASEATY